MISKVPWKVLTFVSKELQIHQPVTSSILNLKYTLLNGQAFSWYAFNEEIPEVSPEKEDEDTLSVPLKPSLIYNGVFKKHIIQFKATDEGVINFRAHPENEELLESLHDYFQLSYDYMELINKWKECDPYFSSMFKNISGIRILRQDPFECLISFICSQNNNIPRITKLIYSLCEKYGDYIDEIQGKKYYTFPKLHQLKQVDEQTLRNMGFGYRAKYLVQTLKEIEKRGGEKWLLELRGKDHEKVQEELCSLMGVGKKVADCVALFSLDCKNVVPIDTHVHQIYLNVYKQGKKGDKGKMNNQIYSEIGTFFRKKFGEYAGWAHSYLFTTELNEFKEIKEEAGVEKKKVNKTGGKKITSDLVVKLKKTEKDLDSKPLKRQYKDLIPLENAIEEEITDDLGDKTKRVKRAKKPK